MHRLLTYLIDPIPSVLFRAESYNCGDLRLPDPKRVEKNLLCIILKKIIARKRKERNYSLGAYEMLQANGWLCYKDNKLPNILC